MQSTVAHERQGTTGRATRPVPIGHWLLTGAAGLALGFILLPLMILTGVTMSPGWDSFAPWLLDLFGGRQSARTVHFITATLIVLFVLMFIQATLAHTGVQGVGALHVVNGVLIFLGTIYLTREATKVVWPGSWFARPM